MNALSGLLSVEFVCPTCRGKGWGTLGAVGRCNTRGCRFQWNRLNDFRVFFRKADGRGFASPLELEAAMRGPLVARLPPLIELIHELLVEVMERPPTVGVVALWSDKEQRQAVHWLTHMVLREDSIAGELAPTVPRPAFIEDGAATA